MSTTYNFGKKLETYPFGCLFSITDVKYGSRTEDDSGFPYVYAQMELESSFLARKRKFHLHNFTVNEHDRIMVSAEITFPSKIYESDAKNEQDRILTNKENFGAVSWHRSDDSSSDHDIYINIYLTLPKEMLNEIILLRKGNTFYAEISYWVLEEEKMPNESPEQKFIVNEFHIRESHTYSYDHDNESSKKIPYMYWAWIPSLVVGIYTAFVAMSLWNWFAVRTLHVSSVSFLEMVGIVWLIKLFLDRPDTDQIKWKSLYTMLDACIPDHNKQMVTKALQSQTNSMWFEILSLQFGQLAGNTATLVLGFGLHILIG